MSILILISAMAAQAADDQAIVVTASRAPVAAADSAASVTTYDEEALDDLSLPALPDLLRLSPGVSVATTGPRGTQTQVRIRGAEANHTLVFLDGIRFNDPAAGNEARFELLTSDALSRLEIVRGPQSALWGSEALGGVIAAETADPFRGGGFEGLAEYGSLDSARLSGRYAVRAGNVGIMASAGWLRSDGIDSFGAGGERDGFDNLAASLKIEARPSDAISLGVVGHWIEGTSQYDGFDPVTFRRADTLDETKNRIAAVRGWAEGRWGGWTVNAGASYLDSANRNRLDGAPLNSTFGDRLTLDAQLSRRLGGHRIIAAVEHEPGRFPRPRHRLFRRHRPGPVAPPHRLRRRMAGGMEPGDRHRSRVAPRQLQRLRGCDDPARLAAGAAGTRPQPSRRLWRGHRPADLLRSLRLLPRLVRRQSGADARTFARLGGRCRLARPTLQPRRHLVFRAAQGRDRRHVRSRDLPLQHRQRDRQEPARRASSSAPPGIAGRG